MANAVAAADPYAAVARATPATAADAADIPTKTSGDTAVDSTVAGTPVTVPVNPSDGITMGSAEARLTAGLPFATGAESARTPRAGVVSYDNDNGSITVPIVQNDGSVQINTVIESSSAPSRYTYTLGLPTRGALVAQPDGTVIATDGTGALIAIIAAPWAKDSTGAPVPTHYEIVRNTLTQVVDFTAATAFPVVADPKLTVQAAGPFGPGFYVGLTGLEMKEVVIAIAAAGGVGAVAVCSGATKLPSAIARLAAVLCTAVGAPTIVAVLKAISSIGNSKSVKSNTCYETLITANKPFVATARGNCS